MPEVEKEGKEINRDESYIETYVVKLSELRKSAQNACEEARVKIAESRKIQAEPLEKAESEAIASTFLLLDREMSDKLFKNLIQQGKLITEAIFDAYFRHPPSQQLLEDGRIQEALNTLSEIQDTIIEQTAELNAIEREREKIQGRKPIRRRGQNFSKPLIKAPNDAATNALFGVEGEGTFSTPFDYMSGIPKEISTGNGISVSVQVETAFGIDEAFEAYDLTNADRYWHENFCSFVFDGKTRIADIDLLKIAGFDNPYQESATPVKREALRSIVKMMNTWLTIDSTREQASYLKKRGRTIASGITHRPVISGILHECMDTEDQCHFVIDLTTAEGEEAIAAVPLAQYAQSKGQLLSISAEDEKFPGLRLNLEHRQMWRYIRRRIEAKNANKTIRIETLFKNIGLEDATSKKKSQTISMLHKMLSNAQENGKIKSYSFKGEGTKQAAFTIVPIKKKPALTGEK